MAPPPDPTPLDRPESSDDSVLAAFAASGVIAGIVGAVAGLVWGGIGGRIAMRVVFLTSNDGVRGMTSDDGFEIGVISSKTMLLLVLAAFLGLMAGFVMGLVRMITAGPTWAVAAGASLAAAAYAGAGLVHTDGIDFRFLGPLWLTIGLFVLLPALWGATVVIATERILRANRSALPARILRRYWGASGWILLAIVTAYGTRALIADIDVLN